MGISFSLLENIGILQDIITRPYTFFIQLISNFLFENKLSQKSSQLEIQTLKKIELLFLKQISSLLTKMLVEMSFKI
jgi:hypothetical protein